MRKSTGTRLRFEILKRDGFRCVYCGVTPLQDILHVDHVVPVADGGTDEPVNLVTSCRKCNLGKSSVSLSERRIEPATSLEASEEHAKQVRAYLKAQKKVLQAREEVADYLMGMWAKVLGHEPLIHDRRVFVSFAKEWTIEELVDAMQITGMKFRCPTNQRSPQHIRYFCGVMKRKKAEAAQPEPAVVPVEEPDKELEF